MLNETPVQEWVICDLATQLAGVSLTRNPEPTPQAAPVQLHKWLNPCNRSWHPRGQEEPVIDLGPGLRARSPARLWGEQAHIPTEARRRRDAPQRVGPTPKCGDSGKGLLARGKQGGRPTPEAFGSLPQCPKAGLLATLFQAPLVGSNSPFLQWVRRKGAASASPLPALEAKVECVEEEKKNSNLNIGVSWKEVLPLWKVFKSSLLYRKNMNWGTKTWKFWIVPWSFANKCSLIHFYFEH